MIYNCFNYGQGNGMEFNTDKQKIQFLIHIWKAAIPKSNSQSNGKVIQLQTWNISGLNSQSNLIIFHL